METLQRLSVGGSRWISRLAALNMLWWSAAVAGLIVLGLFPATFAAYQLVRDWRHDPDSFDAPYARRYFQLVRERALSANLWGYGLVALAGTVYLSFMIVRTNEGMVLRGPVLGLLIVVAVALIATSVHLPFMLAHVDASWRAQLRGSFFYAAAHPLETLLVMAAVVGLSFLFGRWPALAFFFTISPIVLLTVSLDLVAYGRLDHRVRGAAQH